MKNLIVSLGAAIGKYRPLDEDTIRRFAANCSEMKKMAAHDFEDLLQVCLVIILTFSDAY
jgi:hypothetical protein